MIINKIRAELLFMWRLSKKICELVSKTIKNKNVDSFFSDNEIPPLIKAEIPEDAAWEFLRNECCDTSTKDQLKGNPLAHTKRVTFELSNLCNYASVHKKCPLSVAREPEILASAVVFNALDLLGEYVFTGRISFHNYNEPLLDPRLFSFIKYARNKCPDSDIYICTNGSYLTQDLANELVECGVSSFHVSGYSRSEIARLLKIRVNAAYQVEPMKLDDTMNAYERTFTACTNPCFAPLNEIVVNSGAQVSLCCLDWRRKYSLGDLRHQSLEDIIYSKEVGAIYHSLSQGKRMLDLCRRCNWTR